MIMHRNIDSVWINTSNGVTVYFGYNHLAGYMIGYVKTPCGVSIHMPFGKCRSIKNGRQKLALLDQGDADRLFNEILELDRWKDYGIENFQAVSVTEPIQQ